jgi:NADPH:quinone reductase-like Zn-dependent oxidoreductase
VGGAGTLKGSLDAVRFGGYLTIIGVLAGVAAEIPTTTILHKAVHLRGIYVGSAAMFQAMNRAIEANGIKPVIGQQFSFDEAPEALRLMESAGHFGKIVITI